MTSGTLSADISKPLTWAICYCYSLKLWNCMRAVYNLFSILVVEQYSQELYAKMGKMNGKREKKSSHDMDHCTEDHVMTTTKT